MPPHSATGAPVQPHAAVCRVSSGAASQSPCRQTECCRIADSARAGNPASLCRSRGADLLLLEHAKTILREDRGPGMRRGVSLPARDFIGMQGLTFPVLSGNQRSCLDRSPATR